MYKVCVYAICKNEEAFVDRWYNSMKEAPYLRDPYVEKAILEYHYNNYDDIIMWCSKALKIKKCNKSYINEIFSWDHTIYDLLSIAYYYKKEI